MAQLRIISDLRDGKPCLYQPEGWDADDSKWVPPGWVSCVGKP